jgi:hypothetical protein
MHGSVPVSWRVAAGKLPDGITFRDGALSGAARAAGIFPVTIAAQAGRWTDEQPVTLVVRSENLASAASEVLVPSLSAARERIVSLRPGAARELYSADPEVLRDGKTFGSGSAFLGAMPPGQPSRAPYGYRWTGAQEIGLVSFYTATGDDAAWFRTLAVEYEEETGNWKKIEGVVASPALPAGDNSLDKAYGVEYLLAFPPVRTKAIRIAGETSAPSRRSARSTSISELSAYGPLPGYIKLPQRLSARP